MRLTREVFGYYDASVEVPEKFDTVLVACECVIARAIAVITLCIWYELISVKLCYFIQ